MRVGSGIDAAVEIRLLTPDELADLAPRLLSIQRQAYALEAALIGDDRIPALHESLAGLGFRHRGDREVLDGLWTSDYTCCQQTLTERLCQPNLTDMSIDAGVSAGVDSTDPAEGLRAVASLRRLVEQLERLHVRRARGQGWSWQEIATVLGVSRQAVHQKHARHVQD